MNITVRRLIYRVLWVIAIFLYAQLLNTPQPWAEPGLVAVLLVMALLTITNRGAEKKERTQGWLSIIALIIVYFVTR